MRHILVPVGLAWLLACGDQPSRLDGTLTAATAPAAAPSPTAPLTFDASAVDAWFGATIAERGVVGAALVVVRDGAVVLARGYGHTVRGGAAITPDTPFAIGSLSKQFACAAMYLLVDRGKLQPTDAVAAYYPELTRAADITLADLGGHTSGYRDYYPLDFVDERMTRPIAPDELIARYARMPLDAEPRTRYSYSNTGYVILGRVIEKVSGMAYGDALASWIFRPLAMSASLVRPRDAATGHASFLLDGALPAPLEADGWLFAAGDIWASANDMAKWNIAMTGGALLSPASQRAMTSPRALASGRTATYGCGVSSVYSNGETVHAHTGWVGGFHTYNAFVPRTRSAVVILTNDEYTNAVDLGPRILSLVTADPAVPAIAGPTAEEAARTLIAQLQRGSLDRATLGEDLSAYFDDARVAASAHALRDLGPATVTVRSRGERGGLEVTSLAVAFASKTVSATMFRSPDGKIRQLLFAR